MKNFLLLISLVLFNFTVFSQIQGPNLVCQGQSGVQYYRVSSEPIGRAFWQVPQGSTIVSQSINSFYIGNVRWFKTILIVDFGNTAVSGNILLNTYILTYSQNETFAVNVQNYAPSAAGSITGSTTVCAGQTLVNYSIPAISGAVSYQWTLPSGGTGTSTTNSISVNYGLSAVSGNITAKGVNVCGGGIASILPITVNPLPNAATSILGPTSVCAGQAVTYSVPVIANASTYEWTLPIGATGTSTTNSISLQFGNVSAGYISVNGLNGCGVGTDSGTYTKLIQVTGGLPYMPASISGQGIVCLGALATYSVPVTAYATTYEWTLPSGAIGTSTSNSISVQFGNSAISGNISVRGVNVCGVGIASVMPVIVNSPPVPGTISGVSNVCKGQNAVLYIIPTIASAFAYQWTLPSGATGTSTTNLIWVTYGLSAVSGNIKVAGVYNCGVGLASTLAITVNSIPTLAGVITGVSNVCVGQSVVYSIPAIATATSYQWTLPNGATGTSTTNGISVNYGFSAVSENITVKGVNSCGVGGVSTLAIILGNTLPSNALAITGAYNLCQGQNAVVYNVPAITNATSYRWTLPSGATGTSTNNSISVNYGLSAVSGNITVKGVNSCGGVGLASTISITINPLPSNALAITGVSNVCRGQNAVVYSVPAITNATSYRWTLPSGATGTSTNNSISVNYGLSAVSGNITVKGVNSCGVGGVSILAIILANTLPTSAGAITGVSNGCVGQSVVYNVPAIANATSYLWTFPSGATGTSTTDTININCVNSSIWGSISVKGVNSCGNGASSYLAINIISTSTPFGNTLQNFILGQTLFNLQVTGTNLIWYANQLNSTNHINPIINSTLLVNGSTYYVTQKNNGCESAPLSITVTLALGLNEYSNGEIKLYPNPTHSILNLSLNNEIILDKVIIVDH